jgi:hypothetical protein
MITSTLPSGIDHIITTNAQEIGTTTIGNVGINGYKCESVLGKVNVAPTYGYIPIYRYINLITHKHLFTTNATEIGVTSQGNKTKHHKHTYAYIHTQNTHTHTYTQQQYMLIVFFCDCRFVCFFPINHTCCFVCFVLFCFVCCELYIYI